MKDNNDPLNIFNELKNIDYRNFDFYDSLTDEQQKQIAPYVIMRWASIANESSGLNDYYLQAINQIVNINYWDISSHKELVWKLLCVTGAGEVTRRTWIKFGDKQTRTPKIDKLIREDNPDLNDMEIEIVREKFTKESLTEYCRQHAFSDKETKEYLEEYKKYKK